TRKRIWQLLNQCFGPDIHAQIQGLLALRKNGAPEMQRREKAGYEQAFEDGRNFQAFVYDARELRRTHPDFDSAMKLFRELPNADVIQGIAERQPDGAEAIYVMAKRESLLKEFRGLDAKSTRLRFIHFVNDWRSEHQ